MSEQTKTVVRVKDLIVGVKNDEGTNEKLRFSIEYGTLDIKLGDFVLIKGRNGCGKSTFLRLFLLQGQDYFTFEGGDLYFYAEGLPELSIKSYTNDQLSYLKCALSFIGQEERFLSSDSAYSYIYHVCEIALSNQKTLTAAQKRMRLREVDGIIYEYYQKYLEKSFDCKSYNTFKKKNVRAWSGGQQKMINVLAGIIKAKVCGLKLVLMDEPLNNLDGRNKDILNKLIADLRRGHVAVIAITHCQIFDGVNKVLYLAECEDGVRRATLRDCSEPAHTECLESFN